MLSLSILKDTVSLVGVPAAAVIVVFTFFSIGWVPFTTVGSETQRIVSANAASIRDLTAAVTLSREQHRALMEQTEEQNDAMIGAFKEICLNTARTEPRMRACAAIGDLPHTHAH